MSNSKIEITLYHVDKSTSSFVGTRDNLDSILNEAKVFISMYHMYPRYVTVNYTRFDKLPTKEEVLSSLK